MALVILILLDAYIILGVAEAISTYKDKDYTSEMVSPYLYMGVVTVMWLPWKIEFVIQYAKRKNKNT